MPAISLQLPAEYLTVIKTAGRRPSNRNSRLNNAGVENVLPVPARIHPALDDCLGVGITESNVFCDAPKSVADVLRAIAQRRQCRIGKNVRHFLVVSHVLGLDSRHLIQLRAEHQRPQTLMPALGVDQIEDASLSCAVRSSGGSDFSGGRPGASVGSRGSRRCGRAGPSKLAGAATSYESWENPHAAYIARSQSSFQGAPHQTRIQRHPPRSQDQQPAGALIELLR